jgi:hypothetical protein
VARALRHHRDVSLHRDFLPSSWGMYYPTIWDWTTFFGTIGLFLTLLFLFIRFLPMISIFEMRTLVPTILVAALTTVFGMIVLNGLPMPYHPVFNVKRFSLASSEAFFLTVEADDPKFDRKATWDFMKGLGAREINEVEP